RRRHTRSDRDWSSDVCSSDLANARKNRKAFPHFVGIWRASEDRNHQATELQPAGSGMIVAGIMSGTSADGINVAFVRLGDKKPEHPSRGRGRPRHTSAEFKFLAHAEFPYPKSVRGTVLEAM